MTSNLNQTLQNKYPNLEISVLKYSDAMKDNDSKRIDSEFFKREYLTDNILISKFDTKNVGDFAFITDGQHGYHEIDENSNIHLLTAKNVKNWFANLENAEPLAKWVDDKNQRSSLKEKDILVSTRGTVGFCAIVDKSILPAQIDQDIARVKLENSNFSPEFIVVYLNSKFGQDWFKRNQTGMVQQGISLAKLSKCPVPLFPLEFQQQIEQMVRQSHECLKQSKDLYREAEVLLYQELGLNPQNPLATITPVSQSLNFSVRTLKESLHTTGRLDSEYYQIKYDEIEKVIKNYRGGYFQISQSEIKDKNFNPQTDKQYRYIELANIGANGNISEPIVDFGENLPSRAKRLVKTGDMIMSSVEGSLQSCALITDEFDDCIVSTGFYVLNSVNLNSETFLVLFKSAFFQEYLHKFPSGTILTAISKDELRNIIIPKINLQIQTQIAEKIKQSFTLRVRANELLQSAKTKVETAIEQA